MRLGCDRSLLPESLGNCFGDFEGYVGWGEEDAYYVSGEFELREF